MAGGPPSQGLEQPVLLGPVQAGVPFPPCGKTVERWAETMPSCRPQVVATLEQHRLSSWRALVALDMHADWPGLSLQPVPVRAPLSSLLQALRAGPPICLAGPISCSLGPLGAWN